MSQTFKKTRLFNILAANGLGLSDLQYISRNSFKQLRWMGEGTCLYADTLLAMAGLGWGQYTVQYFLEHRAEILSPPSIVDGVDWAAYRRMAALHIAAGLIPYRLSTERANLIKTAIQYADMLIQQLKNEQ